MDLVKKTICVGIIAFVIGLITAWSLINLNLIGQEQIPTRGRCANAGEELINVELSAYESRLAFRRGCPDRLLDADCVLFYSNLMGNGVIYVGEREEESIFLTFSCVKVDLEKSILTNNCGFTIPVQYCIMK